MMSGAQLSLTSSNDVFDRVELSYHELFNDKTCMTFGTEVIGRFRICFMQLPDEMEAVFFVSSTEVLPSKLSGAPEQIRKQEDEIKRMQDRLEKLESIYRERIKLKE